MQHDNDQTQTLPLPPSAANGYPFYSWAGLRITEAANGRSTVELDVQHHHRGGGGTDAVNGGIVAYMFDGVLGTAVRSVWTDDVVSQVTITLNIQYLRMIQAKSRIVGHGHVVRQGSSTVFVDGEILDESGEVCAKCTGIFKLFRKKSSRE
ncbi:PaaI family thioesterase [Sulfobacillus thermosulfidooxidans]|uniref:PaaI family thioesterase n=1 Tax=Sulfobacillus thermosulfidooxidans TaxID=28034 RepID=UPI0006B4E6FA|nr:PaaI family thioesterase [Sulfobacillus thermosulfidooxidans]